LTGDAFSVEPGSTRRDALALLRRALAQAGIDGAALDARLLVLAALGIDAAALATRGDEPLTQDEAARLDGFGRRRARREPVARILGEREFWGLPFAVSPDTLVPRPDTETVVATVLDLVPDRNEALVIADLGTGSGCLLVALLHECPNAFGIGIDRSLPALATARGNARANGVGARAAFAAADWAACLKGPCEIVVSNPPYIRRDVIAGLAADVRDHDPLLALDGGEDGLDAYRTILPQAAGLLAPEGLLAVEIGYDQEADLRRLAPSCGLDVLRVSPDLSGHPRCVALKRRHR
jgi:release factor glutamine methyltransferase